MTLEANVIRDNAVRKTPDGFEVDVRIAWYRSLPLSCIENVNIQIDDMVFGQEQVKVLRDGKKMKLAELAELTDQWWFVQDPITISIQRDSDLISGARCKLFISLATRIPYIIIGPNMPLVQRTDVAKEVTIL